MSTLTRTLLSLCIAATCACSDDYAPSSDADCEEGCMDDTPNPDPQPDAMPDAMPDVQPDAQPDDTILWCPEGESLDLVVRTGVVRGTVEFDMGGRGGARPNWARFAQISAVDTLHPASFIEGVREDGQFAIELMAGIYDLSITFRNPDCGGPGCPAFSLGQSVVVDGSGDIVLDKRIELSPIGGQVTLDGREMPGSDDAVGRGHLWFFDAATNQGYRVELNSLRPAFYSTYLPRDIDFEVRWITEQHTPQRAGQGPRDLPVGMAALGSVNLSNNSGSFDVDAQSIVVDGRITVDGEPIADNAQREGSRGKIMFTANGGPSVQFVLELGRAGDARYAIRALAGTFNAVLSTGSEREQDALPTSAWSVGCGLGLPDCVWTRDGTEELDFQLSDAPDPLENTSVVRGRVEWVTPSGQPYDFPMECINMGLIVRNPETGDYSAIAQIVGDRFETTVLNGDHEFWVQGNGVEGCPVGATKVSDTITISGPSADMVLRATVATLSGEIAVNGQTMADDGLIDGEPRGFVALVNEDYFGLSFGGTPLGESGPARVAMAVLAGQYEVRLRTLTPFGRGGLRPTSQDVLPATIHRLGTIDVVGATEKDFDVSVVDVAGTIRMESGAAEPALNFEPLRLIFDHIGDAQPTLFDLPEGTGGFALKLYAGRYRVSYGREVRGFAALPAFDTGELVWGLGCD